MAPATPRKNQRLRTRKDLLRATSELLREGRQPTMDEIAGRAMVSRATAYRYFPRLESLLLEAPLDGAAPTPESVFGPDAPADPEDRIDHAEAAFHSMTYRNERQLRLSLAQTLTAERAPGEEPPAPLRQNRRTELIQAALAPAREQFDDETYEKLCASLALVFGPESMIVFRDVRPLTEARAREVKSWAVRSLVRAALKRPASGD